MGLPATTQEFQNAKQRLRRALEGIIPLETAHAEANNTLRTLQADAKDQTAEVKRSLNEAKQALKDAEARRKEIHQGLKALKKDDPTYNQTASDLKEARAHKKEVQAIKKSTQTTFDHVFAPFNEKIAAAKANKKTTADNLKTAKQELLAAQAHLLETCARCFQRTDAAETFDAEMTELTEDIFDTTRKINMFQAWMEQAKAIMRLFVKNNPSGWSTGELDEAKRYLMWINLAQQLGVMLEDNPTYTYELDPIHELLGIAQILEFVKIDKAKLEAQAKAGKLRDKDGKPITLDELHKLRHKKLGTPRVKPFHLGELSLEDLMMQLTPDFLEADLNPIRTWEDQDRILSGTSKALEDAGITTIAQLRRMSFHQIADTRGIGEKRAIALFKALRRK